MKKLITLSAIFLSLNLFGQSQTWVGLAGIPEGVHHPVTFAIGDFGYSITGTNSLGGEISRVRRYNPITDSWSSLSNFPGGARSFAIGLEYEGYGYVGFGAAGSQYFKDLWRFDTATFQWTRLADCGCIGRRHPALMAANGKIYVGLGNDNTGDLRDFWVYDIASDTWTQLPNIPGPSRHHPFMFAVNGEVYAGMGHGGNFIYRDWYRFDTINNTWETKNSFPGEARVAGTQFDHNGFGYVLSGDGDNHNFMSTGEMWRYETATDNWTQLSPHPGFSRWAPGSFVIGDTLYFFGGYNRANQLYPTDMHKYYFNSNGISLSEPALSQAIFYPNPSNGMIQLSIEKNWTQVSIYNLQGQLISKWEDFAQKLDLGHLSKAIYWLELIDEEGHTYREKMMIAD